MFVAPTNLAVNAFTRRVPSPFISTTPCRPSSSSSLSQPPQLQPSIRAPVPCPSRRVVVRATMWKNYLAPPPYTGDAKEDLLLAIKHNDNDGFDRAVTALGPAAANMTWGGRRYNQSALLAACFRGRTRMIMELINRGADCTHRNDFGWGAVKYARQYYDVLRMPEGDEVIKILLERGAADEVDSRRA